MAGRRARTTLLILAVAISTALTAAVASVMGTIGESIRQTMGQMVGLMDLRIVQPFGGRIDQSLLDVVRAWPEVKVAVPHYNVGTSLKNARNQRRATLLAEGIDPDQEPLLHPLTYASGRNLLYEGEIVIDEGLARKLDAQIGDQLDVLYFGPPISFKLVGVTKRPELDVLQKPAALVGVAIAQKMGGFPNKVDDITIQLKDGFDAEAVIRKHQSQMPKTAQLQSSAGAAAGVNKGLQAARLLLVLLTTLVFLSSGFIVLTSMTTGVMERARELAILRCIGASPGQLASAQLISGFILASLGAILGAPVGLAIGYGMYRHYAAVLPAGFIIDPFGLALAFIAAVLTGLVAALYPAVMASRIKPMQALASRARVASPYAALKCLLIGLPMALFPFLLIRLPLDTATSFQIYAYLGLPIAFTGYFILGVPLVVFMARFLGPLISRLFFIPAQLLEQSVLATPFRNGLTAGTLMVSIAMLVSIWTGGRSVMSGWFDKLQIPDGFVHSYYSLDDAHFQAIRKIKGVVAACPTTMFPVETNSDSSFGLIGMTSTNTLFVSCDVDAFFDMTSIQWIEGDPETARKKMRAGRAILVSREYLIAHGVGVGKRLTLKTREGPVAFEVVGVVASAGLDLAVQFFGIQRVYSEAALGSVFGTREDAIRFFDVDAINLVLLKFDPDVPDKQILGAINAQVPGTHSGSARQIRVEVRDAAEKVMDVGSTAALGALFIATVGVGNLIIANIAGRRFEYGVLRSIGASRYLLGRLVAGETILVALTGSVIGTALGLQLSWIGQVFHQRILGITYTPHLAWDIVGLGTSIVVGMALLAAMPAITRLVFTPPRMLISSE